MTISIIRSTYILKIVNQQLVHLKIGRLALVEPFKKRKLEQTQSLSAEQLCIDDNPLDTSNIDNTSNIEDEDTYFSHKSANDLESNTEDDVYSNEKESDLGPQIPRTEEEAVLQKSLREKHWNKRGEDNLWGFYGNSSRITLKRKRKVAKTLEKKTSKYNISAFWQCNRDLGLISRANAQSKLNKSIKSSVDNVYPLSQVLLGGSTSQTDQLSLLKSLYNLSKAYKLVIRSLR